MATVSYRPRYTVEDYRLWGGDWELWDGLPVAMSPSPNLRHQRLLRDLLIRFDAQLRAEPCDEACEAVLEIDWHIDESTVVRPDLVIVCGEGEDDFLTRRPELAAEILSPSTREKDLVAKRELYAVNGVPHYLVLDPEQGEARLLALDEEGEYHDMTPDRPFETHPGCEIRLDVASLFA